MLADRVSARRAGAELIRSETVSEDTFAELLGASRGTSARTRTGVTIGQQRALGISAWYSGVRYIAETIAGLACPTFEQSPIGRREVTDRDWKRRPDREVIWYSLVEFIVFCLLHRGNSYNAKLRTASGQVQGLRPIHPDRVEVAQTADGMKLFVIDQDRDHPYTSQQILHIPALSTDGVIGINPIQAQAETLGIVAASDEMAGRSFNGSDMVRSYLSVPQVITGTQAEQLKETWERHHKGLLHHGEIAVMGGGAEYKTIGLDPQQTQLLESRKFGVSEVSRILRLPPHKLYDLERATFSNIEQQSIEAVTDGIRPWCQRIEAHINSDPDLTGPRQFIEFDLEGLMRGDLLSFAQAHSTLVAGGIEMPSEPRRRLNLPHVDGSDHLLKPLAMDAYGPAGAMHERSAQQRDIVEAVQKLYLGVGVVLTNEEARKILTEQYGAHLPGKLPPAEVIA